MKQPDLEANSGGAKASGPADPLGAVSGVLKKNPLQSMLKSGKTVTTYDAEDLTQWSSVMIYKGSIFMQRAVMRIVFMQVLTCWATAYTLYYFTTHPENYRVDAVQEIIKTISISIAFLIGLFLNQCVSRWWDTVKSIELLQGAMKKLVMGAINMKLPKDARENIIRTCVLSIRMLEAEITFNKHDARRKAKGGQVINLDEEVDLLGDEDSIDLDTFWDEKFANLKHYGHATTEECEILKKVPPNQRSFYCWTLVSKELNRNRGKLVTGQGKVDIIAYDRLCSLAQDGMTNVTAIKTLAAYQLPFIYVHMLAFMVHFVNMFTAVGTGVTLGLMLSMSYASKMPLDMARVSSLMVFVVVQAFLYQSFLSIGAALSFPITGSTYNIPLMDILTTLDEQLRLMNKLADRKQRSRGS
jgi:hypothetical protein